MQINSILCPSKRLWAPPAVCTHAWKNTAPDKITPVGKSIHLFIQHGLDQNHRAAGFSQSASEQGGNDDLYDSSIQFINQDDSSIALGIFQVQMNLQTKERQLETGSEKEGEKDDILPRATAGPYV